MLIINGISFSFLYLRYISASFDTTYIQKKTKQINLTPKRTSQLAHKLITSNEYKDNGKNSFTKLWPLGAEWNINQ